VRAWLLASCLVVATTTAALPASADSGRASATASRASRAATTRPPKACGDYQCFYDAEDFLRSVPQPKPEQVATVPLRARAVDAAPGTPGMLVGLDNGPWSFWNVSDGVAQGRSGVVGGVSAGNVFNFRHWQYVDELYYYLHETVAVPPTQWVNAAHRNGVPVLGTVTPDCAVCGPEAAALFAPENYAQTVSKLYDFAAAYGFDGWIIDIEGDDFVPTPSLLQAVQELTGMTLPNGNRVRVVLYHGNEFALGPLLGYFEAGAQWQSDYDTATRWPAQTYQTLVANDLQAEIERAFWASYVYAFEGTCTAGQRTTGSQIWNGNDTPGAVSKCLDTAKLFANQRAILPAGDEPGAPLYYTSAALFAPIWPFVGNLPDKAAPASRALVHAADNALWVGSDARYSGASCQRSGTENAVSAYVTPRSVVGTLPFVTSFNEGEGDTYAVEGTEVAAAPWNNLSVQDVLPTWSCAQGGNLEAATAYAAEGSGDSFNGGSALRLSGAAGEVELFTAMVPVGVGMRPVVDFESKTRRGPLPYVRIGYSDGTSDVVAATTKSAGWTRTVGALQAQGKTITAISVGTRGNGRDRVATLFGRLRVYDADAADADPVPAPVTVDASGPVISWPTGGEQAVAMWNVYVLTGGCLRFLGPAVTNQYRVTQGMFGAGGQRAQYVIQPVSVSGSTADVGSICRAGR
jgi:hypothetical protein